MGLSGRDAEAAVPLHPVPPQVHAGHGGDNGLNDDEIHELPVNELLKRKGPQRAEALIVEPEGVGGHEELDGQEDEPERHDPEWIEEDQAVDSEDIDDRREQRKQHLEDEQVAEAAPPQLAPAAPPCTTAPRCFHIACSVP